jgi:hypothetical protein
MGADSHQQTSTPGEKPCWKRRACLALLATTAVPAGAAPFMIVGNDEKPSTDADGKPSSIQPAMTPW